MKYKTIMKPSETKEKKFIIISPRNKCLYSNLEFSAPRYNGDIANPNAKKEKTR